MELCDFSAIELSRLVHLKQVSAVEILESALNRVAAVDGRPGVLEPGTLTPDDLQRVHAFITLTP